MVSYDENSPYPHVSLPELTKMGCVSSMPPGYLLRSLTFELTLDQSLRVFLIRSSYPKRVAFLSGLIKYVSERSDTEMTVQDEFRTRYELLFFLSLVAKIASRQPTNKRALFDAGILQFLIHILQAEVPDTYMAVIASHDPSDISNIIREHGLRHLLNERAAQSSRILRFIYAAFAALFEHAAS